MIKKILICLSVISLVLISGTGIYLSNYYHADETALEALHSDGNVRVSETDYGWLFDGPSDTFIPAQRLRSHPTHRLPVSLRKRGWMCVW